MADPCCAASRAEPAVAVEESIPATEARNITTTMVLLDGGEFLMGSDDADGFPADGEGPVRAVTLRPFWIDTVAVSNARFAEFVDATGHVTEAERYGWSFVFAGLLPDDFPDTRGVAQAPWWRQVEGACWRHPRDRSPPSTSASTTRWCTCRGATRGRTAAGRACACPPRRSGSTPRAGGLVQKRLPWGDELEPGGEHRMNVWQGAFPSHNTLEDGYLGTCPVDAFPPNGHGLHNTSGNVWEWCADWFNGGARGEAKVIRGGSYLCHHSYCNRYRVAARSSNTPNSSTGNMGFRCARDV